MTIKYTEIEDAFSFVSSAPPCENAAYLNRQTGETYFESGMGDSDELPDDIDDGEKYIEIPHKFDLDLGNELAHDFAAVRLPADLNAVNDIFSNRKGAFSRFKRLLENRNKLEEWYQYEQQRTEQALREWCKDNNIELDD
jgi:hypothetical protein